MCTITLHRQKNDITITMNRDESLSRKPELQPQQKDDLLMPIDTNAGGTWIACRQDGAWGCILNGYSDDADSNIISPTSRGKIIPQILSSKDIFSTAENLAYDNSKSFRLFLGLGKKVMEYFWNGKKLSISELPNSEWLFNSSSSLEQTKVKVYRQKAFENWKNSGAKIAKNGLPKIHLFREEDNVEYGVMMQRDYAETCSITQITISSNTQPKMNYWKKNEVQNPPISLEF